MRVRVLLVLAGVALLAAPASAVTIDWVFVGDPGNVPSAPTRCIPSSSSCGSVPYTYYISKYEVTNAQYAEFLNAKAATSALALYNTSMDSDPLGGITRSGSNGSYVYEVKPGFANKPVNFVSFWDAVRFTNWLHNGQGSGDTETGAYTLLGGTASPSNADVARNPGAVVFLPTDNEWNKAAYFDGATASWLSYAQGSNDLTVCAGPGATPNTANCGNAVGTLTDVGSYTGSASPYGTFDQGGNVTEWNEDLVIAMVHQRRYNGWTFSSIGVFPGITSPTSQSALFGFRVASLVPEPGTIVLVMSGLVGLAWKRRTP